eukprot:157605-Hanusia_phi.AAC.2
MIGSGVGSSADRRQPGRPGIGAAACHGATRAGRRRAATVTRPGPGTRCAASPGHGYRVPVRRRRSGPGRASETMEVALNRWPGTEPAG